MSSSIKITLYRTLSETPTHMTSGELREFLRGSDEFTSLRITQDGIDGVIGDMYVYIDRQGDGAYLCRIHGSGFNAQSRVERAELWATLTDAYGLWSLAI